MRAAEGRTVGVKWGGVQEKHEHDSITTGGAFFLSRLAQQRSTITNKHHHTRTIAWQLLSDMVSTGGFFVMHDMSWPYIWAHPFLSFY